MDMYTLLYLKRIMNKNLLCSIGNFSMLRDRLDARGVWGEWIHVHASLNPFAFHLKLSQHVNQLYSRQNKKLKKFV